MFYSFRYYHEADYSEAYAQDHCVKSQPLALIICHSFLHILSCSMRSRRQQALLPCTSSLHFPVSGHEHSYPPWPQNVTHNAPHATTSVHPHQLGDLSYTILWLQFFPVGNQCIHSSAHPFLYLNSKFKLWFSISIIRLYSPSTLSKLALSSAFMMTFFRWFSTLQPS